MKTGRMFTAIQLMVKLADARAGEEPETDIKGNYLQPHYTLAQLEEMVRAGQWRHRGKGRGSISQNFIGKTRELPRNGNRERRRRMRQMFGTFADQRPGWPG